MSLPAYVHLRYWFYPTGNTPSINLLRELPAPDVAHPEELVTVLSLACGDPRSILFSLWCVDRPEKKCKYDFTCCDMEPAVLARNTMLLTLIVDELPTGGTQAHSTIWNIFYHLYILEESLSLLQRQAGKFLRFASGDTLARVRKIWTIFAQERHSAAPETALYERQVRAAIISTREKVGEKAVFHGIRSAGAMWSQASETMSRGFTQYWETGVVAGNAKDVSQLSKNGKGRVNPMFATSSAPTGVFAVHYGTEPLLGFHVAEAFGAGSSGTDPGHDTLARVVEVAKAQFREWSISFGSWVRADRVRLTLFCGEATRFCQELHAGPAQGHDARRDAQVYVMPWSFRPLTIEAKDDRDILQRSFDVIDTSNLVDHLGTLTVLAMATPLLSRRSTSVLYTESLLLASEDIASNLSSTLCSDITTLSLVIGLAPIGHLLGYTTDEVGNEAVMYLTAEKKGQRQYRMRVPWRIPELGDPSADRASTDRSGSVALIGCGADELAGYLFSVYKGMFRHEDMSSLPDMIANITRQFTSPLATDLRHYTRAGLVSFFRLARSRISTDWCRTMKVFLEKVEADPGASIGINSLQELYMHLLLSRFPASDVLDRDPRLIGTTPNGVPRAPSGEKGLLALESLPPMVHILLTVPRQKLGVFTSADPETIGTPGLHVSISQVDSRSHFENSFHSLHCGFGRLIHYPGDPFGGEIEEDDLGWQGSADMIVICQVPTFNLLLGPRDGIRVALAVNSSPSTVPLIRQLGIRMIVFECGLDNERLSLSGHSPGLRPAGEQDHRYSLSASPSASVVLDKTFRATELNIRTSISPSSDQGRAVSGGAKVELSQISPCTVSMRIGNAPAQSLTYPFPVDALAPRIRVARKSYWVEAVVPVSRALDRAGYDTRPFPVILDGHGPPVTWGIPRVEMQGSRESQFVEGGTARG